MKIPKILYHGTTKARFELGIAHEGLRGDMPVHLKIDQQHKGYVYLCDNKEDAAYYSLLTFGFDNNVQRFKKINEIVQAGVILLIKTQSIKNLIEVDPERAEVEADFRKDGIWEVASQFFCHGNWYRIKGDIPRKIIIPYLDVPIEKNSINAEITQHMADTRTFEEIMRNLIESRVQKAENIRNQINEK